MADQATRIRKQMLRFGTFELDLQNSELRREGVRVQLQPKPLQMLEILLERPREVVTREELKRRLWAEETFVDYESGINTAANRLRLKLRDSAENPRYIETVARIGYRFIAPVERVDWDSQSDAGNLALAETPVLPSPGMIEQRHDSRWSTWVFNGAMVLAAGYFPRA